MTIKVLGFIPARSGSKGVPDKNIKRIKEVPLLEFSVYAAVNARQQGILDEVVVSTDSEHYLATVSQYNIEKDYLRPPALAADESPTIDAVLDVLNWYKVQHHRSFDAVMILQPTSPFRTPKHIKDAISLMSENSQATCVASICKLGDHHPLRIKRLSDSGQLIDFCDQYIESEPSRRQDFQPDAYIRNGAIYLTKTRTLVDNGVIRGDWVVGMEMPEANSINVDEHLDYLIAKASLEYDRFSDDLAFFKELINNKGL